MKRAVDIAGSLVLLVLLAVPMILIALIVRITSRGPVLYRQTRIGKDGRHFTMLKFRSMRVDAESATGPVWARQDDPRRTRVGIFLRRFALDELPQLYNVLRGDMSLVGPRPERPCFVHEFSSKLSSYELRHTVRPGLTGWAQVNGLRGNTPVNDRLNCDLSYARGWSIFVDVYILLLTPLCVLSDRNGY